MAMGDGDVLILVLPTGAGKSIFFMLPATLACDEGGVSIVVVPFIALIDDLVARAREFGIDCLQWRPADVEGREHPQRVPQLLVVSADAVGRTEFEAHADMLRARGNLRRIFVDESHTAITDVDHRKRLGDLCGLHRYGCPVVLLTATLPMPLEGWFREQMIAEEAEMIRASTVKMNIRYRVREVKAGRSAVEEEVVGVTTELGGRMTGDQKGIVYCRSREKCAALAALMGCSHHHGGMDAAEKREALAAWAEGRSGSRWITATTGLGTGIDIKGVVAVVHAEQPYGLVDLVQQTGRGGRREGETVDSVIVVTGGAGGKAWYNKCSSDVVQKNREAMEEFMNAKACRRVPLGMFMDGKGQSCREVGGERCDRCEAEAEAEADKEGGDTATTGSKGPKVGRGSRYGEARKKLHERVDMLLRWLMRVEGWCGACYLRWLRGSRDEGKRAIYQHGLKECRTVVAQEYIRWRRQISAAHNLDGRRYMQVRVQSWMSGKYARYWTVGSTGYDPTIDIDTLDEAGNARSLSMLERILRTGAKRLKESNEQWRRAGQAQRGADYDNEFVKDMRWIEFTEGKDRAAISAAARWANAKETDGSAQEAQGGDVEQTAQLAILCESVSREVKRCEPRIYAVPKPIRQRLHGIEEGKSNPIPFRIGDDPGTLRKYGIVCQRYLCFCWRAFKLGREEAGNRLGMRFTDEQWGLLCDMNHALGGMDGSGRDDNEGSDSHYDSDEDEDGSTQSSQPPIARPADYGELDRIMFAFIMASIRTKVGGAMYTNALLCFFAATAIRRGGDGFQPAGMFTGTVAAMLWILRLVFLEHSFQDMPMDMEEIPVEKMEWFTEQHGRWLCVDGFTVVGTMIRWMAYGKGHRNKTLATPSVRWSNDYETLIHNGEHIRIHEFQRAAYRVKLQIDHIMGVLFGSQWSTIGPNIDLGSIQDDTTYLGVGQSFAMNKANAWLRSGPELAIKAAQSMLFDARTNTWKAKGTSTWLSNLRALKELLAVACHVWGGMPGRGPELSTMRHCDGLQVMRNCFLYDGSVMIVTDRDKAKSIRDMGRRVARFVPDDMGRVLVAYIAWLLPAEELLEQELMLPATAPSVKEFMWRHGPAGRFKTDKLSSLLAREIGGKIGVHMGMARYRMIVIEMGRVVDGLVMEEVEKRIEGDSRDGIEIDELSGEVLNIGGSWNVIWDLQSTHGTKTARQSYAVHVGMPGHLHPFLIRRYHEISRLWHSFLGKGNPMKSWGKKRQAGQAAGDGQESNKRPGTEDVEAESLAALQELEGRSATWRSAKQEECMHAIMRLEGEGARHLICVLPTGAGKSVLFMAPAVMRGRGTTVVVVPFARLIDDLVKRAREKGVDVLHFQPGQVITREALPYVPRLVMVSADVAVAQDGLFMAYMDKLDSGGHLQRIFMDEAHVAITDSSYREQLTKLKQLHRFSKPIIMLTATLMKTMERDFREMLLLRPETPIIRDRTTKKNARYEFVQVGRKEGAVEKATVQAVRRTQTSMTSQERCIVYCKSIDGCRTMAETLGCACHHSGMDSAHCREVVDRWSSGQGSAVMAATTGLGTGLDFRHIVAIFFSGIPYGLVDFVQQTGRGARQEGELVLCMAMHDGVKPYETTGVSSVTLKNQHAMWTVAATPGCVREQIAMIMDGVFGECCADLADAVPCCRCEPSYVFPWKGTETEAPPADAGGQGDDSLLAEIGAREVGTHALARQIDAEDTRARGFPANSSVFQEDYRQRAADEVTVKQWLREVESKCAACFTKKLLLAGNEADGEARPLDGVEGEEEHEALGTSCPARIRGMEPYRKMRKQLRFAALSCCFTCKLPLDWCAEAKEDKGTPGKCVYIDKVLPAVVVAASVTREAQWICDSFDIDPADERAFQQWLAGKRAFMDTRGTNMHMLWAMVVRKTYAHRMRAVPSRLFAKGPYSMWFEVKREKDGFSGELMAWLNEGDGLGQGDTGDYTRDPTDVSELGQPAFDAVDFETPIQTNEQGSVMEAVENNISCGQAGADGAAGLDASWFAVARSGVACVLCTVRGFQLQCMGSVPGGGGGAATGSKAANEAQWADKAVACKQCGLQSDWHEPDMRMGGRADERLRDDKLVCVARVVALWEQMKSVGASLGKFDAKQMAAACIWLETGARCGRELPDAAGDRHSNTGTNERGLFETPRPKAAIGRNGQMTPADEGEYGADDAFLDEELGVDDELEVAQSSSSLPSAPASSVCKRKASSDMAISTPAKMGRQREPSGSGEGVWTAPSLFNEAMVAQVRRTDAGMRHEAMGQHELDAFTEWKKRYQSLNVQDAAKGFRELHTTWTDRCGICWFTRGEEARSPMEARHALEKCPQKGSAIWKSAVQRADVIRSKVLRKKVVGGELVDWPASSGCWRCGLPCWRCDSFEKIPKRFFRRKVPEVACRDRDENMLRYIAGSVLAHFEAGAACVVAQVKESWGKEKIKLESQDGIDWLQDYSDWTSPECSYFALVVFELEKFGSIARSM
ncbi:hypothetical protein V8C42DRAFT_349789 [Trichoderma barbatum]